jgi:serine/threonine-protein kinase HipA
LEDSFAKNELGFDVPQSGLFKREEDKEYHYIIKYFDRHKSYKFQRKECSSYLGLNSDNKYNTSSEKLFDMASKVLLREEDRVRMLEYYFYSFVIKHEDMHTKNISTIYDNGKLFLAPLYDIATTGFYNGIRNYESHLPINGKQTNVRLKDFLVLVEKANVPKKVFLERALFILKTYKEKMPKYIKRISKLEESYFYEKERANAQNREVKIKKKALLQEVMLDAFTKRIDVLEKNLWFEL